MFSTSAAKFLPTARRLAFLSKRPLASVASVPKDNVPAKDGARIVVTKTQDENHPILVAKVGDTLYAFDATCPHMGKSMEKGMILTGDKAAGPDPEIKCRFHNTRFNMKTGVCTKWVTGVFGFDNQLVSGVAQKVGGEKQNITAYQVTTNEDGSLTISDDK